MLLCSGFPVGYIFLAIFRFYEIYKKIKGNTHETQNIQNLFLEKKKTPIVYNIKKHM